MNLRLIALASLPLAACVVEPQPPTVLEEAPLSAFAGEAKLEQSSPYTSTAPLSLRLESTVNCSLLSTSTVVTLDGVAGVIHPGEYREYVNDFPYNDPINDGGCIPPIIEWTEAFATAAATIVLTDGDTTWTMQVDQPFLRRTFASTAMSVRSGDLVTLRMTPAADALISPFVWIETSEDYTTLSASNGLTHNGTEVTFTMPAVPATEQVKVQPNATAAMKILACDVPGGCSAAFRTNTILTLEVSP